MPTTNIEEVEVPDDENIDDVLPDDIKPGTVELVRRSNEDSEETTYARYETLRYK